MFVFPVAHWAPEASGAIAFGRKNTATTTGSGSNYTIGWAAGGAAANGVYLIAVIANNIASGLPNISGGSAWTQATGSVAGYSCYYKTAGASEPSTYTITYAGSAKSDCSSCSIFELTGQNATNPDDVTSAASTATPSTVTSSASSDCVVVVIAGQTGTAFTAPSGYTLQGAVNVTPFGGNVGCAIAAKLSAGSGTISPGAWNQSGTKLWTLAIKV